MRVHIAALLLLGAGLLTSCADSGTEPVDKPPSAAHTAAKAHGQGSDCIPSTTSRSARSREDLVGRSLSDVKAAETASGHDIRVLGENGVCADGHDDLNRKRVNVVVQDGEVIWASMY
jgi:hypothetical protein